jgi:hypothetical protein
MLVKASGTAKVKINTTGKIVRIPASGLDWQCNGGGERQMGPELVHSACYDIEGRIITWSLWEYPSGVENYQETDVPDGLTLVQDIKYGLVHEPE